MQIHTQIVQKLYMDLEKNLLRIVLFSISLYSGSETDKREAGD